MIVLGIDVGSTLRNPTGWAVVDTHADTLLSYGLLKPEGADHIASLACQFDALLRKIPQTVGRVAIESPFVGPNARTGLLLARLFGAYLAVCAIYHLPVVGITPAQGKAAATGSGSAQKAQVQRCVQLRYGVVVPSHVADAIAVALASVPYTDNQEPTP
jgi:crossover junction endodeoxyribonuclease RuvC